ncbi:hypothetical protein JO388_09410 [Streptococcus suis]|uniref:hypothetical protein n=1 Tax=Streptococcus suis TaxID=1307 RepID=UPI0019609A69|nr:hypothetical protein [Streptococcus suis]MBM7180487.1 hypothetical protein [Streptococcus suis]
MTNEKLGVLLVDVPEPKMWEYFYLAVIASHTDIGSTNRLDDVLEYAYRCTQKEAKKYLQFRWVALEELE